MSLVDTHAHLASSRLREDLDEVITRSREADLCRIITIACDLEDSVTNLELAERFDIVSPTVGIHPLYVHEIESDEWEKELRELGQRPSVCAIAEIGLDYFHPPGDGSSEEEWRNLQRDVFEKQLQIAIDLDLPAVIHQRNSAADVTAILRNFPKARAVLHCFTGTMDEAEQGLKLGHMLSFPGIITFKNAVEVQEVAAQTPLERVMVETDCPYLAPVPFRGKRCEPAYVKHTANQLARLRGLDSKEVEEATTANATRFFGDPR